MASNGHHEQPNTITDARPSALLPFPLPAWGSFPFAVYCDLNWPAEKLDAIIQLGESRPRDTVTSFPSSWLNASDPAAADVFRDLANVVLAVNVDHWQFDLWGYTAPLKYARYMAGDRFEWHNDIGRGASRFKLSASVQLSDPTDYEGGDLQFQESERIETAPRARGTAIIFPSFLLHRVTPITTGTRRALIAWIAGPPFR